VSDLDELEFNREFPAGVHLRIHPLLHSTELDVWRCASGAT
jgi:hypothetical protein